MTARLLPVGIFVCLLRETMEADRFYSDLWLEGEVTDLSRSAAGHMYFSLRDVDGALKCVLFRNQALRQHQLPSVGDQVAVHGGLSIYPRSGSIQLVADLIRPAGLGAALLELEYLRQRLEAEGLFDFERKRQLPEWPHAIGVVTSAHGAAWHDIQTVVRRRYPLVELILSPALVQGLGAAESVVAALEALQFEDLVNVIILARGGGDSDDLAAFNDERVVRSVFASRVPVIAGIGHATDRTLVEDVADAYAATPSAAAEICVPSVTELWDRVAALTARLTWSFNIRHSDATSTMQSTSRRLIAQSPKTRHEERRQHLAVTTSELERIGREPFTSARFQLTMAAALLGTLDPQAILRRGYAALHDPFSGRAIVDVSEVQPASTVRAVMSGGTFEATVDRVSVNAPHGAKST
jgi:exodeoxyribonuclease VII large subunit